MTSLAFGSSNKTGDKVLVQLMKSKLEESNYVAMAFSDDRNMGDDAVFACSRAWTIMDNDNNTWNQIHVFLNEEKNPSPVTLEVYTMEVVDQDSFLNCLFLVPKDLVVKGKLFDLGKGHHILLASGMTKGDELIKHDDKVASKYKFGEPGNETGRYITF